MSDLTVIEKLDDILDSKADIKQAIEDQGQNPTDVLSTYAGLITAIGTGDLPIAGTEVNVFVNENIPRGSRFVGTPISVSGISLSVLATFEDAEYDIYPSATVVSQNGKVAFSLLPNNKGRLCLLREDGTKYRYIFDIDRDTNITSTSAKVGTHMGINADGSLALFAITSDNNGSRSINYYVLKTNITYGMESSTLFSDASSVLSSPSDLSNTQIRLGIITNDLILIPIDSSQGGYTAISYTLATTEMSGSQGYGVYNIIEVGERFSTESHSLKPRTLFNTDGMCFAVGYGNHESQSYRASDMELAIAQYHYRGETYAANVRFLNKTSGDYKSIVSTNKEYLIVTKSVGCDIYKITYSGGMYSITAGPYSFPISIRQFDGEYAITDTELYYVLSVENSEYQLLDTHNIYNVGTGDILSNTYVPSSLNGTWAGVTVVNNKEVPCIIQGTIGAEPTNIRYVVNKNNSGIIEEGKIYGIATRDFTGGTTETIKYSFKDEHLPTTSVANDIVLGKTAYSNGEYITGTFEGVLTSDATVVSSDIAKDKIAYARGQKITGNVTTYSSGDTEDTVTANSVTESSTALVTKHTFNSNTMFRNGGKIAINATKQSVANAVGLTANILKRDETVLGIRGTFDGIDYDENVQIAKDILGII